MENSVNMGVDRSRNVAGNAGQNGNGVATWVRPALSQNRNQRLAEQTFNFQTGCEHRCRYCYASAMSIEHGLSTPETWGVPRLRMKNINKGFRRRQKRIMVPSSHDVTLFNVDTAILVLSKLLRAWNDVIIVSKMSPEVVQRLCSGLEKFKKQFVLSFTIGSMDPDVLKYWEPGAPSLESRLAALKFAFDSGFRTGANITPILDENPDAVIAAVTPYVTDTVWLDKANSLLERIAVNCPNDMEARKRGLELLRSQTPARIEELREKYSSNPMIRWIPE